MFPCDPAPTKCRLPDRSIRLACRLCFQATARDQFALQQIFWEFVGFAHLQPPAHCSCQVGMKQTGISGGFRMANRPDRALYVCPVNKHTQPLTSSGGT